MKTTGSDRSSCIMVVDTLTKSLPDPVLTQHREVMLGHTPFFDRLLHKFFLCLLLTNGVTPSKYGGE
jgi:hypothetical protein